jgi:hypothetical protein
MKPILKIVLIMVLILNASPDLFAAIGTTGTPLGGLGASYIVYNGAKSIFVKGYRLTGQHWYQETRFDASFNLYTKAGSTIKTFSGMKSSNEDALIPIYKVKYGAGNNNINVDLLAFCPFVTGDEKSSVMPLAFFEFTLTNNNSIPAEAAISFKISNLLGKNPVKVDSINGVFWSGNENSALGAASNMPNAQITTGSALEEFNANGAFSNSNGDAVAVKLNLEPSQSGKIRFVLGWYQDFIDKDCNGDVVNEGFYYMNYISSSIDAVKYGLTEFERLRDGASEFANRIRAVNLPDWYTDRLLNDLYPLTHNSQYAKDGRFAWREGKYFIIGTIDQQGHAQITTSYNWPEGQWKQMEYWARTQRRDDYSGQIHHDFNGPRSGSDKINAMCGWDDYDHVDYWWSKTENWSDLNSLFIINIYELFLATGNMEKLEALWPYMMKTANRILYQATRCIDNQYTAPPKPYNESNFVLPYQCLGSYDREGATNEYNASLALVAYAAFKEMCLSRGDTTEANKWGNVFNAGKEQFSAIYSSLPAYANTVEGELGVYNFSRHLGLPVVMSDKEAEVAFERYWGKSQTGTDLLPWHFYTINHFGDFGIAIGRVDNGLKVHKSDYEQHCIRSPTYYFWQDLDASLGMNSYMTAPVVWRSYLLISGFCMDKYNKRLWIRPMLPSANKGTLTNAPLISPGNWGTLDYTEMKDANEQLMTIRFDKPVLIKDLRLKNPGQKVNNKIDIKAGAGFLVTPDTIIYSGSGLDAIVSIVFKNPIEIGSNGIQVGFNVALGVRPRGINGFPKNLSASNFKNRQTINYSIEKRGKVKLAFYSANGAQVKSIDLGTKSAGYFSYTVNNLTGGFYYVNLIHNGKRIATTSMVVVK